MSANDTVIAVSNDGSTEEFPIAAMVKGTPEWDRSHAQMTADEWVEQWLDEPVNTFPDTDYAAVPPIRRGSVAGYVGGGVYSATAKDISELITKLFDGRSGAIKMRRALFAIIGDSAETRAQYADVEPFELLLILAWYKAQGQDDSIVVVES